MGGAVGAHPGLGIAAGIVGQQIQVPALGDLRPITPAEVELLTPSVGKTWERYRGKLAVPATCESCGVSDSGPSCRRCNLVVLPV